MDAGLLQTLPWEVIERIFSFVSADDLGRLCCVCRYFHDSIRDCNRLWRAQCKAVWLLEKLDDGCSSWYEVWLKMSEDFGQYRSCYVDVKQAWTLIEDFVAQYPSADDDQHGDLSKALKGGISEQEIATAEAELGFRLPLDLRCSLRFHDGQHVHNPASFLGGLQFYSFFTILQLFPIQMTVESHSRDSCSGDNPWRKNRQYMQIALGKSREYTLVLALEDCQFTTPGHVIQVSPMKWPSHLVTSVAPEHFPKSQIIADCSVGLIGEGKPFKDWLMDHAKTLPLYPMLDGKYILRFRCDPAWEATTRHFTVRVGTSLDPTLGRWNRHILMGHALPLLLDGGSYAYWIIIKMHNGASENESCQLMTRHWLIKYASGREERVDGEGVIGEQPTFTPGHTHQYASCTNFISEEYCTMEGYYTMQYLRKPGTFTIKIPQFYMPLPKVVWK